MYGVYRIQNIVSNKRSDCYIGSAAASGGVVGRWSDHRLDLNKNQHHSIVLQRAWNKYGADAFKFEILLVCDPEDCLFYEQIAIDCYQPKYNICKIAGSRLGTKHSTQSLVKIQLASAKLTPDQIKHAFDLVLIQKIPVRKVAKDFGVDEHTIRAALNGQSWKNIDFDPNIKYLLQEWRSRKNNRKGIYHPRCKLSEADVINIKQLLKNKNKTQLQIAQLYGVSRSIIASIKRNIIWRHIPCP